MQSGEHQDDVPLFNIFSTPKSSQLTLCLVRARPFYCKILPRGPLKLFSNVDWGAEWGASGRRAALQDLPDAVAGFHCYLSFLLFSPQGCQIFTFN
jgi:hypothetical protein